MTTNQIAEINYDGPRPALAEGAYKIRVVAATLPDGEVAEAYVTDSQLLALRGFAATGWAPSSGKSLNPAFLIPSEAAVRRLLETATLHPDIPTDDTPKPRRTRIVFADDIVDGEFVRTEIEVNLDDLDD